MAEESTGAAAATTPEGEGSQGEAGTEATTFTAEQWSTEQWRESVSSEWAEDASMADFKSLDDLAKSYVHAKKLIGSDDRVRIPKEDDPDNWKKFYNKIGRPEEASGYEFNLPEDAPANYESEQFQAAALEFRGKVHDLGLTRSQAEKLWDYQVKSGIDMAQNNKAAMDKIVGDLKDSAIKEFGAKHEEYKKTRNNIIAQYGDQDVTDFINASPILEESPALLKMFDKIGKALGEDKITREVKTAALTPKTAKSKLAAMTTDKNHPLYEAYQTKYHPRHDEAVEEFNRLIGFYSDDE